MTADSAAACFVHQIGTAVPTLSLDAEEAARLLQHACISSRGAKLLQRISRLTGIERRHLVALQHQTEDPEKDAPFRAATIQPRGPGMETRTKLFTLESGPLVLRSLSAFRPEALARIGTLVTVSCTHASSPGLEDVILNQTSVPANVHRWNLGFMGCSAALAGMRLVLQTAARQLDSLVVACELSSLHFQYTDELDQMTANVLFSDGAASVLLGPRPSRTRVVDCRSFALPQYSDQMVWFAGDHGLKLRLSQELPQTLVRHLPAAIEQFLADNNTSPDRINHWLVHPGGPQILDAVEHSLSMPRGALKHSRDIPRLWKYVVAHYLFYS